MQVQRLFDIVFLLIGRKRMTAGELAAHFEVSVRTILRDIDALCAAGIPLYASRGRGGGIALTDGYVLSRAYFSKTEQAGILAAMQQLSAAQYPDMQTALQKLQGIFITQPADWLEVDFTHWGSGPADKEKLACVQAGLARRLAIRFQYSNTRGETAQRLAYPLKLSFKSMAWYVSAYCTKRQDYRVFKLSRMQSVALTDVSFAGLPLAAPPLTLGEGDAPLVTLTLLFHPRQAHRVYDEFDAGKITQQDDGYFRVQAALPNAGWLIHYLLTFGADVEVLEPPDVRAELAAIAEAVLAKYK